MSEHEESTLMCEVCHEQFADEELLRDHREGMHGNRCPVCGSEFTTEALLLDHERTHDTTSAEEDEALFQKQGERKP